jgi:hypothetical protein
MRLKKTLTGAIKSGLIFFLFLLIACQGVQTTVAPQNRIALLQGGPHTGSWESIDVFIEYQYVKQPGTIKLNLGGHAKRGYDQLSVWVLFLDAQGKILDSKTVFNSGFRQRLTRDRSSIEKTFEIPEGTTYFSFQSELMDRIGL